VAWLKRWDARLLHWSFDRAGLLLAWRAGVVIWRRGQRALLSALLPAAFNEGTLTVNVLLNPGTSLAESNRIGTLAEQLIRLRARGHPGGPPHRPRRTGRTCRRRALHRDGRRPQALGAQPRDHADIRPRLAVLPAAATSVGQPISHRLDHLLSGVRAQIALKIYGDDLDTLRGLAGELRDTSGQIPGLTDLQIEKQVLIPQIKIHLDYEQAARYGVAPGPAPACCSR
jgi:HME family heavy-metal exporter